MVILCLFDVLGYQTHYSAVLGDALAPRDHAAVVGAVFAEGHVTTNACLCFANTHISACTTPGCIFWPLVPSSGL